MNRCGFLVVMALLLASCESGQRAANPPKEPKGNQEAEAPATPAKAPPALQIKAWFGSEPLTLEGLEAKVVVLDFWNTTCGPCRKLMPHLAELYTKHKAEGLIVIGITEDEESDLKAFLARNPVAYPIAADKVDGSGATFNAYGIGSIPTACLIGRDGKLAWKGPGEKLTNAMVLAELAKK